MFVFQRPMKKCTVVNFVSQICNKGLTSVWNLIAASCKPQAVSWNFLVI